MSMPELIHAVSTLVQDQVRPTIGILRRRIEELSNRRVECSDIEHLVSSDVFGMSGLRLEGTKGSLCVDINTVPSPYYVDPMDTTDPSSVYHDQRIVEVNQWNTFVIIM